MNLNPAHGMSEDDFQDFQLEKHSFCAVFIDDECIFSIAEIEI